MLPKLVIWGAGGHAMVVADIIRLCRTYQIVGFLDDVNPTRNDIEFCGARILGGSQELDNLRRMNIEHVIIGVGDCEARLRLAELVRAKHLSLATAVHPQAIIASDVPIGQGTIVAAGAVINPGCTIGENTIINTCASIDHECVIDDGVHISPGVHLAGKVSVSRGAWVGIGAVVVDRVSIGAGALVGAGAVVVGDVPEKVLVHGVPARVIRKLATNG